MHFEWSCALKATLLMVGGCGAIVGLMLGIVAIQESLESRTYNATGGLATAIGKGLVIGLLSVLGLLMVCIVWYECYEAVCPMARMPNMKAAPASVAQSK